jgi:nicotinate phosphoribosyltransferase
MIFVSSGFDEYKITEVLAEGAPIDGFGVGTNMGVSRDAPSTDMAYKLVEYDGRPVLKLSTGKVTLPAGKQVFRTFDGKGRFRDDTIALREEEAIPDATPLLAKVMENGKRMLGETLDDARARCAASLKGLPEKTASPFNLEKYAVRESEALRKRTSAAQHRAQGEIQHP